MPFFAHRITTAVSKALNSKIRTIKNMAYGFRSREHFKRIDVMKRLAFISSSWVGQFTPSETRQEENVIVRTRQISTHLGIFVLRFLTTARRKEPMASIRRSQVR
jgi:hypothetical protein